MVHKARYQLSLKCTPWNTTNVTRSIYGRGVENLNFFRMVRISALLIPVLKLQFCNSPGAASRENQSGEMFALSRDTYIFYGVTQLRLRLCVITSLASLQRLMHVLHGSYSTMLFHLSRSPPRCVHPIISNNSLYFLSLLFIYTTFVSILWYFVLFLYNYNFNV